MAFQILSLSGGGYRGLFTIEVLARLEKEAGRPIGECFDMIAGTSIGGVIAIGLAMGKRADEIKKVFLDRGETIFPQRTPPRGRIARAWALLSSLGAGPKYDGVSLRETIESVVGVETLIGHAKTRLLVPAVNMTKGKVQMFKTPHHARLRVDLHRRAADVAMATSAAPLFFPMAKMDDSLYADGGLIANSPDACAIHEAVHFNDQQMEDIRVLSIGTTTSNFALPGSLGANFGPAEWIENQRIVTTVFSAQQQLVDFMVGHQLPGRYVRIDANPSTEQAVDLGLDVAETKSRSTLLGLAEGAFQDAIGNSLVQEMLTHRAPTLNFRGLLGEGGVAADWSEPPTA